MRFSAPAAALSLALAVTASVGFAQSHQPSARALALVAEGRAALDAGEAQAAQDAFEAALAVDPAYGEVFIYMADAARAQGLQGKAIRLYREALERDPGNLAAISGEGAAMVEKGALAKAELNLAKLQSMCGADCPETRRLAAAIEGVPQAPRLAAEDIAPDATITQN